MNTKREDILAMVNRRIAAMGATKKVSKACFNRMWAEEFTEVKISPHRNSPNAKYVGNLKNAWTQCQPTGKAENPREL